MEVLMKHFRFLGLIVASCAIIFGCDNSSSASDNDSSSSVAEEISSTSKDKSSDSKETSSASKDKSSDSKETSSDSKDKSSDSKGSSSSSSVEELDIGNCETAKDAKLQAQISEATAAFMNMVYSSEFALKTAENYKNFQSEIANATELFSSALKSQPGNCEAQLGYALVSIVNLLNDAELNTIIDTLLNGSSDQKRALINIYQAENYASEVVKTAIQADSTLITDRIQGIVESNALPTVQQSLKIFKNLIDNDFYYVYEADGIEFSLGKGEFQLTAGALQATEAALTILASHDLDASLDGSYNWIQSLIPSNYNTTDSTKARLYSNAVNHALSLLSTETNFLSIKQSWRAKYTAIPELLDSAVGNVKNGLQTLLDSADAKKKATSAALAISNGEMGDISKSDVKKAIDALSSAQKIIRTSVTVNLGEDMTLEICPKKFFGIVDGIQDYLPYYKLLPMDEWLDFVKDSSLYTWTPDFNTPDAINLAQMELKQQIISKFDTITDVVFENDSSFIYYTQSKPGQATLVWESDLYDDCTASFKNVTGPVSFRLEQAQFPISEKYCIETENEENLFASLSEDLVPDVFHFTDSEGNTTISLTKFVKEFKNGNIDPEIASKYIIFPDPTINGVFPDMTQEKMSYIFFMMLFSATK